MWAVTRPAESNRGSSLETNGQALVLKVGRAETSRFLASEAERLALARSVRLPVLLDVGRLPSAGLPLEHLRGAPYLLMTRLPGRSLLQVISESLDAEQRSALALAVARDAGRALADLHDAGVAHGDVKPGNVLVDGDGLEGSPWSCTVCDLGLATTNDQLTGATVRYLPPEVTNPELGLSSAIHRDLWALGITLLEVLLGANFDFGQGDRPLERVVSRLDSAVTPALLSIVAGLCTYSPATRPRARWVAERAGAKATAADYVAAIERNYLAAQGPFLEAVLDGAEHRVDLDGVAATWLARTSQLLSRIPSLNRESTRARSTEPVVVAQPLNREQRKRFLVAVCGVSALDFAQAVGLDEAVLLDRMLRAAEKRAPGAFSSDLFAAREPAWLGADTTVPEVREAGAIDVLELALELGRDRPNPDTLRRAEHFASGSDVPLTFTLSLAMALKRQGELGRARAVLAPRQEPMAGVALAGVLARSGATKQALSRCELHVNDPDPSVASAAAALQARLLLARGAVNEAERCLMHALPTAAVLEARASVELSRRNTAAARELLVEAQSTPSDAEQSARIAALIAHLDHQEGNHEAALTGYRHAVSDAARAGALVEEATYLVGVASTAAHLAQTAEALAALERAELLFQLIGNPAAQARAALNRASTLAVLGAIPEATSSAKLALQLAHEVRDSRCEALGHLLLAVHLPLLHGDATNRDHWQRARDLMTPTSPGDELRLAASALTWNAALNAELQRLDDAAVECPDVEIALEWWTARARLELSRRGYEPGAGTRILAALSRLMSHAAPVDAVGQAYAAGAELAARLGDGDRSLQFIALARDAHRQLVEGAPAQLRLSVRQLPWATWLTRHASESPLRAEQIAEIERLVKDLSDRGRLRPVLERSLDALVRWTGVERGLLLMNAPEGKLVPRAARNLAREDLSAEHRQLSQSLARRALETGDCVVAMDASGEMPSLHQSVHALKLRSVLAVPLTARGETVGVVYLDDRVRRGAFGSNELAWVRLVGSIAAVAIADARDQARLRRAARRATRAEQRLTAHLETARGELAIAKASLVSPGEVGRHGLVGNSPPMRALYQLMDRVGNSPIPVLIFGESGTGKELVARALHKSSPRAERPFVSENCSAIPAPLLESILFGHKKGAFTGAVQNHAGLFETANGGTLFLDELGEMSLPMQAKLLRVLETGELRRVGDDKITKVDVRILGASHRDLEQMVAAGTFREDLYYRLNVITVRVPPLRERTGDIPDLVRHFLKQARSGAPLHISPAALAMLQGFAWPGNVRQLENELRRASVLADDTITPEHLSATVSGSRSNAVGPTPTQAASSLDLKQQVDALEAQLIERALREAGGNQSRAADALGVSRFGLQKMVKRLGLALPK